MAQITRGWDRGLANDFKDAAFVRAFVNAALDEGVPIQQVLRKLRIIGVRVLFRDALSLGVCE